MTLGVWNKIFVSTWEIFVTEQEARLQKVGWSNVTSGWDNTGLTKGDIADSKNWQNAADTLGLKHDLGVGKSDAAVHPCCKVHACRVRPDQPQAPAPARRGRNNPRVNFTSPSRSRTVESPLTDGHQ